MTVTMATFVDALTTIKRSTLGEVADFCRKTIPKENRKFAHFNLQEILFALANRAYHIGRGNWMMMEPFFVDISSLQRVFFWM